LTATQEELKQAIQLALDDGNEEVASELRDRYLSLEEESDVSWLDEAMYAWDSTNADYENWAVALEAKVPMGNLRVDGEGVSWDSPEELYGDEFADMSYDERREFLLNRDRQAVEEEYADVIDFQEEHGKSGSADFLGSVGKTVVTPTSLFVLGKGLAAATATGAVLGAETELADQTAQNDYDLMDVAKSTGIGAAGGAAANRVEKVARHVFAKSKAVRHDKAVNRKADNLNREIMDARADGLSPQDSTLRAQSRLGIDEEEMVELAASGKIASPSDEAVAKHAAARENLIPATEKKASVLTRVATPISSRIKEISEPVFGRLRKLEMRTHERVASHVAKTRDFMVRASKLAKSKDKNYLALERALMNGQKDQAKDIASKNFPEMVEQLDTVSEVLDDMYADLVDAGVDVGYNVDYFPRKVKDMEGLMKHLGRDLSSDLDRYLDRAAVKKGYKGRAELDPDDRDILVNRFLSGDAPLGGKLSIAQQRTIEELTEGMQEFYHSAPESLMHYTNKAIREAEKRRFFGKNVVLGKDNKVDLDDSVGSLVAEQADLSTAQLDDLKMMLKARFDKGEMASHELVSGLRNIQTAALLGQFDSALIQLGDVGTSIYMNGLTNTIRGMGRGISKKGITSADEMGVIQNIAADIQANGVGADVVDKALRYSGFRAVDKLGKDSLINAAHIKNTKLALKRPDEVVKKWGSVFGDEIDGLLDDLRKGRNTENVRLLLFNELSDAQPISLSEMPEAYLSAPNGRLFYALKSFALKQLDLVKRTAIDEMRNGNYLKGFKNLSSYAAIMGLSGGSVATVRDWIQTKEFRPEQLPDKSFETLMGIMFMNDYARNKYASTGDFAGYLQNLVAPAAPQVITTAIQSGMAAASADEDADPDKFNKVIKDIPVMGKLAYYWMFGGAEKKLERERKEDVRKLKQRLGTN
jgi:hypothetical protein